MYFKLSILITLALCAVTVLSQDGSHGTDAAADARGHILIESHCQEKCEGKLGADKTTCMEACWKKAYKKPAPQEFREGW